MKMRGEGRIFNRKGSPYLWIAYYHRGKEIRESSGTADKNEAGKLLKQRLREIGAEVMGLKPFVGPKQDRILMKALFEILVDDYKIRGKANEDFYSHLKPVREFLDDMKAVNVTTEVVDRFIRDGLDKGLKPATLNRRTQYISQAFGLAMERKKIAMAPKVRHLEGDNVREGFLERHEFEAIAKHLPGDLQDFCRFAYLVGWRKKETQLLKWEDFDFTGGIIRLKRTTSKNGEPRRIALDGEILEIIKRRLAKREIITATGVQIIPFVFHRNGKQVNYFRKAWISACTKAGIPGKKIVGKGGKTRILPGKLFHDFRRTAVRNMVRAGVDEKIAMTISGHKTRSVFDRYNITSEDDLREAVKKTQRYVESLPTEIKNEAP